MDVQGMSALLLGLEPAVAEELSKYLAERGMVVSHEARLEDSQEMDLVFCSARGARLGELARGMKCPVVAVSRLPETQEWLDAMDAGAADYCAAPFEREQMDWILESNLRGKAKAAVA
jgi:DNA-binding response OmpR family regulator